MSKSINRDPIAVFALSNARKAGNTKMGKNKKKEKEKDAGRTLMIQKWSLSIKPFGSIHTE